MLMGWRWVSGRYTRAGSAAAATECAACTLDHVFDAGRALIVPRASHIPRAPELPHRLNTDEAQLLNRIDSDLIQPFFLTARCLNGRPCLARCGRARCTTRRRPTSWHPSWGELTAGLTLAASYYLPWPLPFCRPALNAQAMCTAHSEHTFSPHSPPWPDTASLFSST